ncbi:MAG: hypothetical protein LBF75_05325 [Treponema sp.]|nr:hypothetical protein [Treponema sp.]
MELIIHGPELRLKLALIAFLKNSDCQTAFTKGNVLVGEWFRWFTSIIESPKAALNIAKNRPYSVQSVDRYKSLLDTHIKDIPSWI